MRLYSMDHCDIFGQAPLSRRVLVLSNVFLLQRHDSSQDRSVLLASMPLYEPSEHPSNPTMIALYILCGHPTLLSICNALSFLQR